MIRSFTDKTTARIYQGRFVRTLPLEIQPQAHRKLQAIDAATRIEDLRFPTGNRLEALQGQRSGQWSIRINARWRICFEFVDGDALNVGIVDYH
jgi:proteic killer suppression protein